MIDSKLSLGDYVKRIILFGLFLSYVISCLINLLLFFWIWPRTSQFFELFLSSEHTLQYVLLIILPLVASLFVVRFTVLLQWKFFEILVKIKRLGFTTANLLRPWKLDLS